MPIRRGEIYYVDLGPVRGREQAGVRPVLVLSINMINDLPLVITVVPGTKGANEVRDFPTNVRVPPNESGLPLETIFKCFQITCVDPKKFPPTPAGKLSAKSLERVEKATRLTLGL